MTDTAAQKKTKKTAIRAELREKTAGYIVTALGLVAGLAWNNAIGSFIKYFFPLDSTGLIAQVIYAVIITVIVVILSNWLLRILAPKEDEA